MFRRVPIPLLLSSFRGSKGRLRSAAQSSPDGKERAAPVSTTPATMIRAPETARWKMKMQTQVLPLSCWFPPSWISTPASPPHFAGFSGFHNRSAMMRFRSWVGPVGSNRLVGSAPAGGYYDSLALRFARCSFFGFSRQSEKKKDTSIDEPQKSESTSLSSTDGSYHNNNNNNTPLREEALESAQDLLIQNCVKLLEMCSGGADGAPALSEIDNASRDVFFDLVDAVLHDYSKTPAQQFDLAYAALCLPAAQQHPFVRKTLMAVMEAIVPGPLYQFLASVDLFLPDYNEESVIKRSIVLRLARSLMGEIDEESGSEVGRWGMCMEHSMGGTGGCEASPGGVLPDGVSEEEILMVYLDDFKKAFPHTTRVPAFATIEKHALDIALRSKFYTLLGRLCVELDTGRTGKIELAELQAVATRVLGRDRAEALLNGAPVDAEGKLRYAQLCALISKSAPVVTGAGPVPAASSSSPV